MPLETKKISNFDTPLIKVTTEVDELQNRIKNLFDQDKRFHSFVDGSGAVEHLQRCFLESTALYVGMFNDKPICAVLTQIGQDIESLSYLVMHRENFNRGIEEQFLQLIYQQCTASNVKITSENTEIMQLIKKSIDS